MLYNPQKRGAFGTMPAHSATSNRQGACYQIRNTSTQTFKYVRRVISTNLKRQVKLLRNFKYFCKAVL